MLCASQTVVIDKWGYLWTGSGAFLYDGDDATSYSVLRFNTADPTAAIRAFRMTHEANVSVNIVLTFLQQP